jgi:hypothetical protein
MVGLRRRRRGIVVSPGLLAVSGLRLALTGWSSERLLTVLTRRTLTNRRGAADWRFGRLTILLLRWVVPLLLSVLLLGLSD